MKLPLALGLLILFVSSLFTVAQAQCCNRNQGVDYCDKATGRIVCKDGSHSKTCSCPKHSYLNSVCCKHSDGVNYCDRTTGRLVCNAGNHSNCSCPKFHYLHGKIPYKDPTPVIQNTPNPDTGQSITQPQRLPALQ